MTAKIVQPYANELFNKMYIYMTTKFCSYMYTMLWVYCCHGYCIPQNEQKYGQKFVFQL